MSSGFLCLPLIFLEISSVLVTHHVPGFPFVVLPAAQTPSPRALPQALSFFILYTSLWLNIPAFMV